MMREGGLTVDHSTIFRRVRRYAPEINKWMLDRLIMDEPRAIRHTDSLLTPYLCASLESDAETFLTQLLSDHAAPIIAAIIRRQLQVYGAGKDNARSQETEDLHSEVVVQLLARLRDSKLQPGGGEIGDFRGYVAVVTFHACHQHLRRKYPQRWRLKNRLRYLLTRREGFALWESAGREWLCGLAEWRGQPQPPARAAGRLRQLREQPQILRRTGLVSGDAQRAGLTELATAIFQAVGVPVEFDELVGVIADLQGVREPHVSSRVVKDRETDEARLPDPRVSVATEIEQRSYLQLLWSEILQLPQPQRLALLLNLRDAQEGVIELLPLAGVASLREIAAALALPAEEFARLWNALPLDDTVIAARLGITRQQVINLRKAARARLGRRMGALDKP